MAVSSVPAPQASTRRSLHLLGLFVLPVVVLAGVIALFALTDGAGLNVTPAAPEEAVTFGRTELSPGTIELHVRNTGPDDLTISQVNINDAIWPFTTTRTTIPRLGSATIRLDYPWVKAQAYQITLFSGNSIAFSTEIPVAAVTAHASGATLGKFTLVGFYVGIIPVVLGMFWLPALRQLGPRAMLFLMAATVGLLIYLGIDALGEALEQAGDLGTPFQGLGIIGIGVVGTFILLDALGRRDTGGERNAADGRLRFAWLIAVGIGFHNLGEGLAIGAAYTIGAASLGTFLVIGFIIQNITEGLGILIPIAKDRPSLRTLALLGVVGGGPAIAGAWLGGLVTAPAFSVLFLAIGAGAVFQVAVALGTQLVWKREARAPMPLTAFAGVTAGMLVLFVTGLLVK